MSVTTQNDITVPIKYLIDQLDIEILKNNVCKTQQNWKFGSLAVFARHSS